MGTKYKDVLESARQLSPDEQVELAKTLLRDVPGQSQDSVPMNAPMPLEGLSLHELRVLADAIMVPEHQAQLQELLKKNREGTLSSDEQGALNNLLDEVDQVAFLKARALVTLSSCA